MSIPACDPEWHVPLPTVPHLTVEKEEQKGRVLVVGDPHGCFEELQDILTKANFDASNDTLIIVGDLVNKGPKSVEVVRYARENNALCVRGNHDDTALSHALGTNTGERKSSYDYVNAFSK
jgi:predicted phosphodiesterase